MNKLAMDQLIKSTLYTSLGAGVLAKEKLKEFIEELIQNNELTQEEGRRVINQLIHRAEDTKIAIESRLESIIDHSLLLLKLPGRNELEIKWTDLVKAIKNKSVFSFLKKELDLSPTVK